MCPATRCRISTSNTVHFHRSLADAEAAAYILLCIMQELQRRFRLLAVRHELLVDVQTTRRRQLDACIRRYRSIEG